MKNPPKPNGIHFSDKEIITARNNNHPLMLMQDYGSPCDLGCIYCFNSINQISENNIPNKNDLLTLKHYEQIIEQAKNIGIKTILIPGEGEPTLDNKLWQTLPLMKKAGITPIVFTNGNSLTLEQIDTLYNCNATVGIKVNSFNSKVQDWIVNRTGYTEKRNITLNRLIEKGFNKFNPTRLWLDVLVCNQNYAEIPILFEFCRNNNIWPGINTLFHMGSGNETSTKERLDVSPEKIKDLWYRLSELDCDKYHYEWTPRPAYVAWDCNFFYFNLRIDNKGNIYKCLGTPIIGNILENDKVKKDGISYFWNQEQMKKSENILEHIDEKTEDYYGCACRRCLKYGKEFIFKLNPENNLWKSNN